MFHLTKHGMKKYGISRAALLAVALLWVAPLMAFTLRGGEGFEIYLGKKLILQQFLNIDKAVKAVDLSAVSATDVLNVSYNHCGQTGTGRVVSLKDKSRVLKEWKFADIKQGGSVKMRIPVKELLAVQKNSKGKQLVLFYSSDLLKDGRTLAELSGNTTQASLK